MLTKNINRPFSETAKQTQPLIRRDKRISRERILKLKDLKSSIMAGKNKGLDADEDVKKE